MISDERGANGAGRLACVASVDRDREQLPVVFDGDENEIQISVLGNRSTHLDGRRAEKMRVRVSTGSYCFGKILAAAGRTYLLLMKRPFLLRHFS